MPSIGFVFVTHNAVEQTARLIKRLNAMFDTPPIVQHHDFGQCALPDDWPSNVRLVKPWVTTNWGDFGVCEGTLRAIRLLYEAGDGPDWFVVMSSTHYPIQSAQTILEDLAASPFDAHMRSKLTPGGARPDGQFWERYHTRKFKFKFPTRRGMRQRVLTVPPPWSRFFGVPFNDNYRCFRGSQWFSATTRAAQAIIAQAQQQSALARHYRHVLLPDESYFQTLLANTPDLKVDGENNLCYIRFPKGQAHPDTLTRADWPILQDSYAHFARKFDPQIDSQVLDDLDEWVMRTNASGSG